MVEKSPNVEGEHQAVELEPPKLQGDPQKVTKVTKKMLEKPQKLGEETGQKVEKEIEKMKEEPRKMKEEPQNVEKEPQKMAEEYQKVAEGHQKVTEEPQKTTEEHQNMKEDIPQKRTKAEILANYQPVPKANEKEQFIRYIVDKVMRENIIPHIFKCTKHMCQNELVHKVRCLVPGDVTAEISQASWALVETEARRYFTATAAAPVDGGESPTKKQKLVELKTKSTSRKAGNSQVPEVDDLNTSKSQTSQTSAHVEKKNVTTPSQMASRKGTTTPKTTPTVRTKIPQLRRMSSSNAEGKIRKEQQQQLKTSKSDSEQLKSPIKGVSLKMGEMRMKSPTGRTFTKISSPPRSSGCRTSPRNKASPPSASGSMASTTSKTSQGKKLSSPPKPLEIIRPQVFKSPRGKKAAGSKPLKIETLPSRQSPKSRKRHLSDIKMSEVPSDPTPMEMSPETPSPTSSIPEIIITDEHNRTSSFSDPQDEGTPKTVPPTTLQLQASVPIPRRGFTDPVEFAGRTSSASSATPTTFSSAPSTEQTFCDEVSPAPPSFSAVDSPATSGIYSEDSSSNDTPGGTNEQETEGSILLKLLTTDFSSVTTKNSPVNVETKRGELPMDSWRNKNFCPFFKTLQKNLITAFYTTYKTESYALREFQCFMNFCLRAFSESDEPIVSIVNRCMEYLFRKTPKDEIILISPDENDETIISFIITNGYVLKKI